MAAKSAIVFFKIFLNWVLFVPALPWLIYILTQAPVHAWVMHHFGLHLASIAGQVKPAVVAETH